MRIRTLLSLALLCALPGLALAQEQTVNCASGVPCTTGGPQNTGTGDSLQIAFSKVNANTTQLYGMFGATGLLKGVGAVPTPLIAAGASDVTNLFSNCVSNPTWALLGGGTCGPLTAGVTSISLSVPAWETVTPGSISTSGTFIIAPAPALTANQFIATPNGFSGPVGVRAIVLSDLPAINLATTGNGGVTGTLPTTQGGTGSTSGTAPTATALAATPTQCAGSFATGIAASGNANCSVSPGGTTFTIASGCGTPGGLTGGATAGKFTAGQTACAPVITLPTAPNGWICQAWDLTTTTDTLKQTATSTTSCTMSGTVVSADLIIFSAMAY